MYFLTWPVIWFAAGRVVPVVSDRFTARRWRCVPSRTEVCPGPSTSPVWAIQPALSGPFDLLCLGPSTCSVWALRPPLSGPFDLLCLGPSTCSVWAIQPALSGPFDLLCLGHSTCSVWALRPPLSGPFNLLCLDPSTCSVWAIQPPLSGPSTCSVWADICCHLAKTLWNVIFSYGLKSIGTFIPPPQKKLGCITNTACMCACTCAHLSNYKL